MITPYEDKLAIKALLDTDPYIKRAGFTPNNISMTRYGTDTLNTASTDLKIFIYNGTPENPYNSIQKGVVYNITVVGKRENATRIDNVCSQIISLLTETDIGRSHILYLLDPPIELESDSALYVSELSFISYETIFNKKKS